MSTSALPKDFIKTTGESNDHTTAVIMLTSALLGATDQLIQRGIKPEVIAKSLQQAASRSAEVLLGSTDQQAKSGVNPVSADEKIRFGLANRFHGTLYFSMKPHHKLSKAATIYAKKCDLAIENVELWFEGIRLSLDDTVQSCRVGHLDIIDVIYNKRRSRAKQNPSNADYASDTVHSIDTHNDGTTDESELYHKPTKRDHTDESLNNTNTRKRHQDGRFATRDPSSKNKEQQSDEKPLSSQEDKIKLTFSDWVSDNHRRFAMGRDTEFSRIAEMFATEKGKKVDQIRLFFNGDQLNLSGTPNSYGLSKGDVITVMEELLG